MCTGGPSLPNGRRGCRGGSRSSSGAAVGCPPPARGLSSRRAVQVRVNGEPRALDAGATVAELVAALGLGPRRIAVEVNRAVVPRAEYAATVLREGDAVEIINFVGGG